MNRTLAAMTKSSHDDSSTVQGVGKERNLSSYRRKNPSVPYSISERNNLSALEMDTPGPFIPPPSKPNVKLSLTPGDLIESLLSFLSPNQMITIHLLAHYSLAIWHVTPVSVSASVSISVFILVLD